MLKTFIEIGSCDFDTNMPLIESGEWLGVMVEPAPYYFKNLQSFVEKSKYNTALGLVFIANWTSRSDIGLRPRSLCSV